MRPCIENIYKQLRTGIFTTHQPRRKRRIAG